jgi:hypothetical protein
MSNNTSSDNGGGIGFCGALTILFIGLKLGHVIDWPWIWVLAPTWITLLIAFVFIATAGIILYLKNK